MKFLFLLMVFLFASSTVNAQEFNYTCNQVRQVGDITTCFDTQTIPSYLYISTFANLKINIPKTIDCSKVKFEVEKLPKESFSFKIKIQDEETVCIINVQQNI